MDPEGDERATLCHLQLKCQLPLNRGCFFEVAGWVWSSLGEDFKKGVYDSAFCLAVHFSGPFQLL